MTESRAYGKLPALVTLSVSPRSCFSSDQLNGHSLSTSLGTASMPSLAGSGHLNQLLQPPLPQLRSSPPSSDLFPLSHSRFFSLSLSPHSSRHPPNQTTRHWQCNLDLKTLCNCRASLFSPSLSSSTSFQSSSDYIPALPHNLFRPQSAPSFLLPPHLPLSRYPATTTTTTTTDTTTTPRKA